MKLDMKRLRSRAGHSIIEVLIGMTVLAITIGSAYALSINTSTLHHRHKMVSAAVNLADLKMEELRNTAYTSIDDGYNGNPLSGTGSPINTGGASSSIYYRWWSVTDNDPAPGMKTVVVWVAWYERDWLRGYPLVGVISE